MLTQHQAVCLIQVHIEGVVAAGGHGITTAVGIIVILPLDRVVPVDLRDGAGPGLVAGPGADQDLGPLLQQGAVILVDRSLDAVLARLHQRHKCLTVAALPAVAAAAAAATSVDGLHHALDRTCDLPLIRGCLQLLQLLLLQGEIILRLQQLRLDILDLQGKIQLIGCGSRGAALLQRRLLRLQGFDIALHLLHFKPGLFQRELHGLGVISKQDLALFHMVPSLDLDLVDDPAIVLLNHRLTAGRDDPGEPIIRADIPAACNTGDTLYRHRIAVIATAAA